jgi:hypothetical protein
MLIDVEDAGLDTILNACFVVNVVLSLLALVPWRVLGAPKLCRMLRWVPIPILVLTYVYEAYMPSGYNIRVDRLILLPLYVLALATTAIRWNLEGRRLTSVRCAHNAMYQRTGASRSFPCFGEPQHLRSTSARARSAHQAVTAFEQSWSTLRKAEP